MTNQAAPKLPKWPFFAGDLMLLSAAGFLAFHGQGPLSFGAMVLMVGAVLAGAWICVVPFLKDHHAALKIAEVLNLKSATEQIENLRGVANQISFATAQWQIVQDQAGKTIQSATDISERMIAESQAFGEFMTKANDAEKAHLRLEVEKLRRAEGDWLQTIVRMLDHVYALYLAGVKSGQEPLREQLGNFQHACRDAARRIGLSAFEAKASEAFDERKHQLPDAKAKVPAGAKIAATLATGFTYQGRIVRAAVVTLEPEDEEDSQLLLEEVAEAEPAEVESDSPATGHA